MEKPCTATRYCFTDTQDNITLCYQFMGTMATKVYREEINLAAPASGSRRLRSSDDKSDVIVEEVKDKKDEECLADKYDSYPWSYIVEKGLDTHWKALGYTEESWNNIEGIDPPESENKSWTELSDVERIHAKELCFDQEKWNARNYTLDHSLRGHGDSSCLLHDDMIADLAGFDSVFLQPPIAWYTNIKNVLSSATSPEAWVQKMTPTMYFDALDAFLTKLSSRTKNVVLVLGQIGSDCQNKIEPEAFAVKEIPDKYGWQLAPKLWEKTLTLFEERKLDVQIVDARDPLMQSVHAHPSPDCLHFCMNSAAVNMYLDLYWNEVFSRYS